MIPLRPRTMITLLLLPLMLFCLFPTTIVANSFGRPGICDAHGPFGCTTWNVGSDGLPNRLSCADSTPGFMDWATRPVHTNKFTLTADTTDYTPDGDTLLLTLTTHDYDLKYRGILLHAVTATGVAVGSMLFPETPNPKHHSPLDVCPHAALHTDAELKPFRAQFRFKAPPKGAGTLTFRCLIKTGPANDGDFWYPNDSPLTLTEAEPDATAIHWLKSVPTQSCSALCLDHGLTCDLSAMSSITSADAFISKLGTSHLGQCNFPILSDCSPVSPTSSSTGDCYYHDPTCPSHNLCKSAGLNAANGHRFCACDADRRRLQVTDVPSDVAADVTVAVLYFCYLNIFIFLLVFMHWLRSPTRKKRREAAFSTKSLAILTLTLLLLPPTHAHNWMHTPARANNEASTTKPCRGRKLSDTHAQVGPDQSYAVKWATGHNGATMLLTIKDEFESYLSHPDLLDMVTQYVADSPDNLATTSFRKYHGTNDKIKDHTFYDEQLAAADGLYTAALTAGDEVFDKANHPRALTNTMYEYKPAVLADDSFANYYNEKYPWIDSAGFFKHVEHLPKDFDSTLLKISGRSGPGHYVTFWKWRGYYDCTDVDYFDYKLDEDKIYGVGSGEYKFSRLDHCEYVNPKDVVTQCFLLETSSDTVDQCLAKTEMGVSKNLRAGKRRLGVNVVPLANPSVVAFDTSNIPWDDNMCVATLDEAKPTLQPMKHSAVAFDDWEHTKRSNKKCPDDDVIFEMTSTLREAILACTDIDCGSIISTTEFTADDTNVLYSSTAQYLFQGCAAGATLSALTGSYSYSKPASFLSPPAYTTLSAQSSVLVSFSRTQSNSISANVNTIAADKVYDDNGELFQVHHEGEYGEYGWNCDTTANKFLKLDNIGAGGAESPITFLANIHEPCDNKSKRVWEMAVADGVYRVTSGHAKRVGQKVELSGCTVENARLPPSNFAKNKDMQEGGFLFEKILEVTDGRITLDGGMGCLDPQFIGLTTCDRCNTLNDIVVERINADLLDVWFPPATNPIGHVKFDNGEGRGVGLVRVVLPDAESAAPRHVNDDRSWLFYKGNKLREGAREKGEFGGQSKGEGAVVQVYKSAKFVGNCETVTDVSHCLYNSNYQWSRMMELCPVEVNCNGLVGDQVKVKLFGEKRVADFKVEAFWDKAYGVDRESMSACYGVEARLQKDVEPEFILTDDPLDPKFYSSCWVREELITFSPPQGEAAPEPESPWAFDGVCMDCGSWFDNFNRTEDRHYIPVWVPKAQGEQCMNCGLFREELKKNNGELTGALALVSSAWPWAIHHGNETDGGGGGLFGSKGADVAVFGGLGALCVAGAAVVGYLGLRKKDTGQKMKKGRGEGAGKHIVGASIKHRTFEMSRKDLV